MALIGTLRAKMTKFVVGFIALAMIAFIVGTDLFGNGPRSIFAGNKNKVGEIAGHAVMYDEYLQALQEREQSYLINFGRQAGEREQPQLRQEAWELLILKYAINPQFQKVGVEVTSDEVWDMIQGRNVEEGIKTQFVDSAGNFDRSRLTQWLSGLDNVSDPNIAQMRVRWEMFKKGLVPSRERLKYEYLLTKTSYVTDAEAENEYHSQNDVVEGKYLYVPYFSVSDSTINPTDAELNAYYEKNKAKYKTELTRSLDYIAVPIIPSAADSAAIRQELERTIEAFRISKDDSLFATGNSDAQNGGYTHYTLANLPAKLADQRASLKEGELFGPTIENGAYRVIKISKIGHDTIYTAKASHILIKWDNETPEGKKAAKEKARKILSDIRKGASFAAKAAEFGTDGTKTRGGDLGWFSTGQMVKPFQDAVFNAKKAGLLDDVVETQYGYHIIEVTAVKDNSFYNVAAIERDIVPSEETHDRAFRKADSFAEDLSGVENFKERAKRDTLNVFEANDIGTGDRRINNLSDARRIVTWLFGKADKNDVSEVFDLGQYYVVAVMTGETKAGFKPLDKVKDDQVLPAVKDELKAKVIEEKLKGLTGTLDEIAKGYGPDAVVYNTTDLKLNSSTLPNVGVDPVAVGKAFSVENGKRTPPIKGERGVVIFEVQSKSAAPAIGDYSMFRNQLMKTAENRSATGVGEAIKDAADIQDRRYQFF